MTESKDRQLAEAVLLLKEVGLEEAAQLLARAWAAAKGGGKPSAAGRRRRTVKAWLPRAREWVRLPADALASADRPGPAGCMLEKEAEDVAKRCKT